VNESLIRRLKITNDKKLRIMYDKKKKKKKKSSDIPYIYVNNVNCSIRANEFIR
jgi:hypothetical protein